MNREGVRMGTYMLRPYIHDLAETDYPLFSFFASTTLAQHI